MNWHEIFINLDGKLYWRARLLSEFTSEQSGKTWNTRFSGKIAGWVHKNPKCKTRYIYVGVKGGRFPAHRIIWEMRYGKIPKGMSIDHIDGNGLNNHISNLRIVTDADNQKNLPTPSSNTSGLSGVSWFGRTSKWRSYVTVNGSQKHLGYHDRYEDAVNARIDALKKYNFHENHGRKSNA